MSNNHNVIRALLKAGASMDALNAEVHVKLCFSRPQNPLSVQAGGVLAQKMECFEDEQFSIPRFWDFMYSV